MNRNPCRRVGGWAIWGVALAAALGGCASGSGGSKRPPRAPHGHGIVSVDTSGARNLPVLDGKTGQVIGWDALVERARAADVVVIGEVHGHGMGGAATVALFEDVAAGGDRSPVLSMEFFERDHQAHLDDYLGGISDEAAFRARTGRTDGNYPAAHRALIEAARAEEIEVIGANAPRRYATVANKEGWARLYELTPEQQRLFVNPGSSVGGRYEEKFFEMMKGMGASHGAPEGAEVDPEEERKTIEGYFRAQNVWDATMAGSIAGALARGGAPVVHVVGQFHSDFDGGLIQRIRERVPGARILTVSLAAAPAWREAEDKGRADVVVMVGEEGESH